jgi:SCY1-like protein 2
VEKEHAQHLRDAQRIEDRSTLATDPNSSILSLSSDNSPSDFAKLVGAGAARSHSTHGVTSTSNGSSMDDIWGSILNDEVRRMLPISIHIETYLDS